MKLTLPQQDVYFEQLLYPGEPIYNIGAKIAIDGEIDENLLQEAYFALITQHDAYRSVVHDHKNVSIQSEHNSKLERIDFSDCDHADQQANAFMQETFKQPFDFAAKTFLHRFILIKINNSFHYLFSVYHHIITDGWGTSLMFQRLVNNYNELLTHGKIETDYTFSYKDFVEDDEQYHNSAEFESDKLYWTEKFKTLPQRLFEKLDETLHVNKSDRKQLVVKRAVYNQLAATAKSCKASSFHLILGILYLYFARIQRTNDIAIGLPVLNRSKSVFKKTVGLFMGVSALRIAIDFEETFEDLVQKIRQQLRNDYRHQRFPLGKLIQALDIFQQKDRLFNLTLSYEKQNYADHFKHTKTSVSPMSHQSERVALALYIREFDEQEDVVIDFDYNINYFTKDSIAVVLAHFDQLISEVISNPRKKLAAYECLSAPERNKILFQFNQTQSESPKALTFLSFFQNQVVKRPGHLAIKDETSAYSYRELDILSNKVANYLQKQIGADKQLPVAVLMDRSVNLLITLIGIWKAGFAYIPLDPGFPAERLEYIIEHSQVDCIIGTKALRNTVRSKFRFLIAEEIISAKDEALKESLEEVAASNSAYIIYTSGSTGKPKGVEVGHRALLNLLLSIQQKPGVSADDLLFSVTTQSFDISILEFFTPLISGATLYIAQENILNKPSLILQKLSALKPTIIQATPSFYQMLFNAGWAGNKKLKILCGGDLLSETLAEKLCLTCREIWNMYGPTETTIWSSTKKITSKADASNIGTPINNTQFYILDECLQLLPVGSVGAVFIGGEGLAKGYYRNDALTSEKFIDNPFGLPGKIYETGDLGKWNEQGEILFAGRDDHQVKVRGYRIELGEIETRINQLDIVKSSIVVAQKNKDKEARLIAFVIFVEQNPDTLAVLSALRRSLPNYMIPQTIIPVDNFPLTPNKKVDRNSLSKYVIHQNTGSNNRKTLTGLEVNLRQYFQTVLEIEDTISVKDNFFALGGHSLSAVKLISLIDQELHFQLSLKNIFEHPTIELLSAYLSNKRNHKLPSIQRIPEQPFYRLGPAQYAIWLASQQLGKSIAYNMTAVFTIEGEVNRAVLNRAFRQVIKKYEILRTNFIEIQGAPAQKIAPPHIADSFELDSIICKDNIINEVIQKYIDTPFDLENQLLIRVGLCEDDTTAYLVFCTHHIIMDGWSLDIFIREVISNYKKLNTEHLVQKNELNFQFKDYMAWQNKKLIENEKTNAHFWNKYLESYNWKVLLPQDSGLIVGAEDKGASYDYTLDTSLLHAIKGVADQMNVTLHTFMVAAFNSLLYRWHGHQDICIGTLNAGRSFSGLNEQIGMFVKTLPLRSKINRDQSFSSLAQKNQEDLLLIDTHQDVPENIQNAMRIELLLTFQNPSSNYENIRIRENLALKLIPYHSRYSRIPLLINISEKNNQLNLLASYNATRYEASTIELIMLKYENLINQIIANPDVLIGKLHPDLILEGEEKVEIKFNF